MAVLNERDAERKKLELEECFDNLLGKSYGADNAEIESLASKSATDFRNTGKMNIYKPTLKGQTPRKVTDGPIKPSQAVVARMPSGNGGRQPETKHGTFMADQ